MVRECLLPSQEKRERNCFVSMPVPSSLSSCLTNSMTIKMLMEELRKLNRVRNQILAGISFVTFPAPLDFTHARGRVVVSAYRGYLVTCYCYWLQFAHEELLAVANMDIGTVVANNCGGVRVKRKADALVCALVNVNSFGVKSVYIRTIRKLIGLAEQRTSRVPSR